MKLRAAIAVLFLAVLAGCTDEDSYKYCTTYTQTNEEGAVYTVEECCVETCEQEFDGDIDCDTECTCTVEGEGPPYACPIYRDSIGEPVVE